MISPKLTPEERRRIETILDRHLYPEREKQWETKCRVCGEKLGQFHTYNKSKCSVWPNGYFTHGKRADDPLPHTTSDAQMREDRERLPVELRVKFLLALYDVLIDANAHNYAGCEWALLNATPEQQAIAMARALGEKIEG